MGIGFIQTCESVWAMINQARKTAGRRSRGLETRLTDRDRMMSRRKHGLSWLAWLTILLVGLSACNKPDSRPEDVVPITAQSRDDLAELKHQIEAFAQDEGQNGEAARKVLESYPLERLVSGIQALRAGTGGEKTFELETSFALCFFGHDYENNKSRISAALRASRDDKTVDSVLAERMISRLIKRGDSGLLFELFNAATWSDGALSEGLADTFGDRLVNDLNGFLMILSRVSSDTRRAVYRVIEVSSLSKDEIVEANKYLTSGKVPSSLRSLAKELLSRLKSN